MLEIIPSEGERLNTAPKTPGVRHFAITVGDFDAALEDLRGKGVDLGRSGNGAGNPGGLFQRSGGKSVGTWSAGPSLV